VPKATATAKGKAGTEGMSEDDMALMMMMMAMEEEKKKKGNANK